MVTVYRISSLPVDSYHKNDFALSFSTKKYFCEPLNRVKYQFYQTNKLVNRSTIKPVTRSSRTVEVIDYL